MTGGELIDRVDSMLARGLHSSAYDCAQRAIADGATDDRLKHRAVLALARMGARQQAWRLLRRYGLAGHADPDIAALEGRLLKDMALAADAGRSDAGRSDLACRSADAYEAIWRRTGLAYQGINAATMALVAGQHERARALATAALAASPEDGYWPAVTRAEALLVLRRPDEALRALEAGAASGFRDYSARATTRRQLRLVAGLAGIGQDVAAALPVPMTLHFAGHRMPDNADPERQARWSAEAGAAIDGALTEAGETGRAFGGLASGADILIAEAVLRRGGELTVVLPFARDDYVAQSVAPSGPQWTARFDACFARASIVQVGAKRFAGDDLDFAAAGRRAMGLALLHAAAIDGPAQQLVMWDGKPPRGGAGTAVDVAVWRAAGHQTRNLGCAWSAPGASAAGEPPARRWMSVLFGDMPQFGTLDDAELARFYASLLPSAAAIIERHSPRFQNAWGDAIQLAFDAVGAAAGCALDLQAGLVAEELARAGLPSHLVPRLALDFGPMLPVYDAVQKIEKFAGRVMTRASRIEPVTPPGEVYVTEAFATELALDAGLSARYRVEYAGLVPTAKNFGELPLYALARRSLPHAVDAARVAGVLRL